jgi:hypothetical protein
VKTDDERKLLVLARSHRAFVDFCFDQGINPHGRDVVYVNQPDKLRGYREDWLVVLSKPSDEHYLDGLIVIGSLVLVDYEDKKSTTLSDYFPLVTAKRGGIRFGETRD